MYVCAYILIYIAFFSLKKLYLKFLLLLFSSLLLHMYKVVKKQVSGSPEVCKQLISGNSVR